MIKRGILLFVFSLLIPIAYGQWFVDAEKIDVNLRIEGEFELVAESNDPSLEYITTNITLFPQANYRQDYTNNLIIPPGNPTSTHITFTWEDPEITHHQFLLDSDITILNKQIKVKDKVSFPVKNIPQDALTYLEKSPTIDFEDLRIKILANSLAEGEDDLFVVVSKLADWTQENIQYNLSTLTATTSEKASWVLENRKGVCDELTNLFIALGRSLGIPMRFISGISYTESPLFPDNWGLHGWAEVYFPGYGWVDFDVTYGEYGYISPTHIKLKDAIDATEPSSRYNWYGRDVNVRTEPLDFKTTLIDFEGEIETNIKIETSLEKEEIGIDSYNLVNVKITNLKDYYTAEEIRVFSTDDIEVVGSMRSLVMLKPFEEKTIYFTIKIPDLDDDFYYIYPVQAVNSRNESSRANFTVINSGASFTLEEIELLVAIREESEVKEYSKDLSITCNPQKDEFYTYEENMISCELVNLGNVFFEDMDVCFDQDCKKVNLGISETQNVNFDLTSVKSGKNEVEIVARNLDAVKTALVKYSVLDSPEIEIKDIIIPAEVEFKDIYDLEFLLTKESFSDIYNVTIVLSHDGYSKEWNVPVMDKDRKFTIEMQGSSLYEGENELLIETKYFDKNGNLFSESQSVTINLKNLNLLEKTFVFSNKIGRKILFADYTSFKFIAISAGSFAVIFYFILRRKRD